jgi:hypothetical protein
MPFASHAGSSLAAVGSQAAPPGSAVWLGASSGALAHPTIAEQGGGAKVA